MSDFKQKQCENEISRTKVVLMPLEHTAIMPKYPTQVKRTWYGFNNYHTKHHWILKLFATRLNLMVFQNLPKMWMLPTYSTFCKPGVLVCFFKPLLDPWLLAFIHRLGLAEFIESSKLAKPPISCDQFSPHAKIFTHQMEYFAFVYFRCTHG